MYKIIGADDREYGPVPADQLRKWIAEGRANRQTRAQLEGADDWKPLAEFPEFADLLQAQASIVPSPPKIATAEADRFAALIVARDYQISIGDCFSRSWRLLQEDFWLLVGGTAVVLLISLGLGSLPAVGTLASLAFGFVFWGGVDWLFLKRIRGQPADMSDVFAGFTMAFVPLLLASIVVQLLTFVGLLLCLLPGLYLFVIWWGFTSLLILDKKLDFWPAMEVSRKVVNRHWWTICALAILASLVGVGGLLLLGVGIFLTLPLAIGATVYAYQDIFGNVELSAVTDALASPAPATTSALTIAASAPATPTAAAPEGTMPAAPAPRGDPSSGPSQAPPADAAEQPPSPRS